MMAEVRNGRTATGPGHAPRAAADARGTTSIVGMH
jgi:hypothetical protein